MSGGVIPCSNDEMIWMLIENQKSVLKLKTDFISLATGFRSYFFHFRQECYFFHFRR